MRFMDEMDRMDGMDRTFEGCEESITSTITSSCHPVGHPETMKMLILNLKSHISNQHQCDHLEGLFSEQHDHEDSEYAFLARF